MTKNRRSLGTKLIHAGEPDPRIGGAVTMPIFQSATYQYAGEGSYHDLRYLRLNNTPNHRALSEKIASLENAEAAVVTASGMAAITASLLSILSSGDHFLAQDTLYGGTYGLLTEDFPSLGIEFDFLDGADSGSWKAKLRPNTKAFYVEAITNPLLQVADLEAVAAFSREHGLVSIVDNTFPSPINYRPIERGFDLSIYSATKYLNGHSDIVAGSVLGSQDRISAITRKLNHSGATLDPHACFLLHRGLKTLALRMQRHNQSALTIARFLKDHPLVGKVHYPGLPSHPHHERARRLFEGFSGMVSFELPGGGEAAEKLLSGLTIPIVAPSLGGVESLITRPVTTSHCGISKPERDKLGITEGLIRLSVGIEDTDDLLADLDSGLKSVVR